MSEAGRDETGVELHFPSTQWGRIRPGSGATPEEEAAALETLARSYWRPIHAWLSRACSRGDEEARDLTQDFFAWVIETGFLRKADPDRGRFRAFLKTALRHYVADADRRSRALRRGGGRRFVPLQGGDEDGPAHDPAATTKAPDELLDETWRGEVVRQALERVEEELGRQGRLVAWAVFRDYFLDPSEDTDYGAVAERHGITTVDVSNHLMRAKRAYRRHLRALVQDTVQTGADLEEELVWLLGKGGR